METKRDAYHLMVFLKKRLNFLDVVRNSVEKAHSTCTTQLFSSIVFESSYFIGSSEQNSKKQN